MNAREILIYLSLKFNGDYRRIREAIEKHEYIDDDIDIPKTDYKAVTIVDEDYPEELKRYTMCPIVLFYYGDLSLIKDINKNLAVIGSRITTEYGSEATKEIVKDVAKDVVIVSGMARGIDSIAQAQAIKCGGKTVAILGSGIDYCYPETNRDLYEEIKKNHLVISEYPGQTQPTADQFRFRNRLIAMLSNTVLITEAYRKSGTSITANIALNIGKNVCCLPYPIGRYSLCNHLISQGAYLIENGNQVLDLMKIREDVPIFDL